MVGLKHQKKIGSTHDERVFTLVTLSDVVAQFFPMVVQASILCIISMEIRFELEIARDVAPQVA